MMVPNAWYPGYPNASSQAMVKEYVAKYGGTASDINADVAEAYSVGEVAAQAVNARRRHRQLEDHHATCTAASR